MTKVAGSRWDGSPDRDIDRGRRRLLLGAAALAAAAPLASIPASAIAADPRGFVAALGGRIRDRAIELTALSYGAADRPLALQLLWAAFERDLAAASDRHPLRLYDLFAALGSSTDRSALAMLVRGSTTDAALLSRAELWADASRPAQARMWRTIAADGAPLGIYIAPV